MYKPQHYNFSTVKGMTKKNSLMNIIRYMWGILINFKKSVNYSNKKK